MPAAALTWRRSDLYNTTAETLAGLLAGLKAAIDAEVAANPADAQWMVGEYSAVNGTLTLKNTAVGIAAGGSSTRRLMLFGLAATVPHTLAIDGASASANLYCGCAPTANVDTPQQSFIVGKPYTTGEWIPGGYITNVFTFDKVEYFECAAGIMVVFREGLMTASSGNLATGFMGGLGVTMDGNTEVNVACGSSGVWGSSQDSSASGAGTWITTIDPASSAGYTRLNYLDSVNGVVRARRLFDNNTALDSAALRGMGSERYFFGIPMRDQANAYTRIRLRQIAFGMRDVHGSTISDADGVVAYKIGGRTDIADDGPWLTNDRV